jgi:hypothetical protein
MLRCCLVLATSLAAACASSSTPYDDAWGAEDIPTGKSDGLLDGAQVLTFDQVGSGFVDEQQMDIYAIDLKGGDQITATMTVTSGVLSPHFTLFFGGSSHVGSKTFERKTKKIVKTYALEDTGRYFVSVRAFQNQGEGKYTFSIACNGGPCNGEPVIRTLTIDEQAECITAARRCGFADLPRWNGFVGDARARTIFQGCLNAAQTEVDGVSCETACDEVDDAKPLCESIIKSLPFYADATPACLAELDDCMATCHDLGGNGDADELWESNESICWETGFNGTCDGYARGHKDCGGTYADDTNEQCHALCESTDGAWVDDLDTICSDSCD